VPEHCHAGRSFGAGTTLARPYAVAPSVPATEASDIAAAFEAESLARCREGARLGCFLGIILITVFAFLDRVRFPSLFLTLLSVRLTAAAVLGVCLWMLMHGLLSRHVRLVGAFFTIAIGLMFDMLMIFTGGAASPFCIGASLVILGANLVVPWSPRWASAVSVTIASGYFVGARLGALPGQAPHLLLSNFFYLAGTATISIFTSAMSERLRWREFCTRRSLIEASRHKNEFFANMSHELRTPIHVMIGYADILLEEALDAGGDEARRLVEGTRRQGLLLNRLISDLLDYSKLEAGKMDVSLESVALPPVVEQTAESFRPVAERKGLRLVTHVVDPLSDVLSDRWRVQQILNNLVGNAVKFTNAGEVRIDLLSAAGLPADMRAEMVFLGDTASGVETGSNTVVVAISDTGIGIQQDDLATLARDFQQLDNAERYGGTGLGLSFSRKLVTLLGGSIAVRSRRGEGSTFMVFLPTARRLHERISSPNLPAAADRC
jgi:signal transduction histidine kinase